jgi:GNAT superfamily N-acetyltransferase
MLASNSITLKLANNPAKLGVDDLTAINQHVRRITVTAWAGNELAGTLTAYMLDINSAYYRPGATLEDVGDVFDVSDEMDSLCCFAYGSHASDLAYRYQARQRIYRSQFRTLAAEFGYQRPSKFELMYGEDDFSKRMLYVYRVSVELKFQRMGIGSMLIQKLGHYRRKVAYVILMAVPYLGNFQKEGGDDLTAETAKVDAFYRSLGFAHAKGTRWMLNTPEALSRQALTTHLSAYTS